MSKTEEDNHSIKYEKGSDSSIEEEVKSTGDVKSEAEKRFLRKLNLRLLPLASLAIFLQVQ
jgi:hypothetical protein